MAGWSLNWKMTKWCKSIFDLVAITKAWKIWIHRKKFSTFLEGFLPSHWNSSAPFSSTIVVTLARNVHSYKAALIVACIRVSKIYCYPWTRGHPQTMFFYFEIFYDLHYILEHLSSFQYQLRLRLASFLIRCNLNEIPYFFK